MAYLFMKHGMPNPGFRAWAQGIVVRSDTAHSNEGMGVQMMIARPFQFKTKFQNQPWALRPNSDT